LLFIGAGFIIHALSNEQDLRKLGGLFKLLPYIYVLIFFASLALMGMPYLSGFYSKEKILESSFYIFNNNNLLAFWLGSLSALFTSIYSIKLIYLSFFNKPNNYKLNYFKYFHFENKLYLNIILSFLGLGSVFSGYFLSELLIGAGTDLFLFNYNNINYYGLDFHIGNLNINLLAFFYTLIGIIVALIIFNEYITEFFISLINPINIDSFKISLKLSYKQFYDFFSNRWYINYIYNRFIGNSFLFIGYNITFLIMDQGYIHNGLGQLYIIRLVKAYLETV
jgi:NADH-ubiquinone oxidoreductase chain 5